MRVVTNASKVHRFNLCLPMVWAVPDDASFYLHGQRKTRLADPEFDIFIVPQCGAPFSIVVTGPIVPEF